MEDIRAFEKISLADEDQLLEYALDLEEHKYQNPNPALKLLPYYHKLEDETNRYLDKIFRNLSKTILCCDFQVGLITTTRGLKNYFNMYGYQLTKKQHVQLLLLYYEILTMKSCPAIVMTEMAEMYSTLIKKATLLTREDVVIPWRPLYETFDRCVIRRTFWLPASVASKLEESLKDAIFFSNIYFENNILQDVIDEFGPYLCPSSSKLSYGLKMLESFLPFLDPSQEGQVNKYLEFLIEYTNAWNNGQGSWGSTVLLILGNAAWKKHGGFDWSPYLALIYSSLLKALQLPVHFRGTNTSTSTSSTETAVGFDCKAAANWIIATLGNKPDAMKQLKIFLKTLETYFNPLNEGSSCSTLASLLNWLIYLFAVRLTRERYVDRDKRWWRKYKTQRLLTDQDVEEFVRSTWKVVLDFYLGVYNVQYLALLRPDIVIPAVLERYEVLVDTVTEPSKYLVALDWVGVIIAPLARCRQFKDGFDGRKYIIPIGNSLLPAIDPNDSTKTLSALRVFYCIFSVAIFADCSSLSDENTNLETKQLVLATASLQDFSLEFFDRVISLIENKTHQNTRMSDSRMAEEAMDEEDSSLEKILWDVFQRLTSHSSTEIVKALADRIVSYALSTTLETQVSGRIFATILQACTVARPDVILPKLIRPLCTLIQDGITEHDAHNHLEGEEVNKDLQFHLLLLSVVVETDGVELMKHKTELQNTIFVTLKLSGKKTFGFATTSLEKLLGSLVMTYPLENRISQSDFDNLNYLAVEEWGLIMDAKDVVCKWHIPNHEELEWAISIFLTVYTEYSEPLTASGALTKANEKLNKKLLKMIQVLQSAFQGIQSILAFWDDIPNVSYQTVIDFDPLRIEFSIPNLDIRDPETSENIMKSYFKLYSSVKTYLDSYKSDDTEVYIAITRGLNNLLMPNLGTQRRIVNSLALNDNLNLDDNLKPKKRFSRAVQIAHAFEIHLERVSALTWTTWTKGHDLIMSKLFELSLHRYQEIRVMAQTMFCEIVDASPSIIGRRCSHLLLEKLRDGVAHEELKGSLYVLLTCSHSPILVNSWENIRTLWAALSKIPCSEKNSIIKCMDAVGRYISGSFTTIPIQEEFNPTLQGLAQGLISTEELKEIGPFTCLKSQEENREHFQNLLLELTTTVKEGKNHWRQKVLSAGMLSILLIEEMELPKSLVEYYFDSLLSETQELRKDALTNLNWILGIFKRKHPFVTVNTSSGFKLSQDESIHSVLQYKSKSSQDPILAGRCTVTDENGNRLNRFYLHKNYFGFTSLPKVLKVKLPLPSFYDASQSQQTRIIIEVSKNYMESPEYLTKLIGVWCQEKSSGTEFWRIRSQTIKFITRNNGPDSVKLLLTQISGIAKDKDQWKQVCAAEVLSGILAGVKHWSDASIHELWVIVKPILNDCLENVTQETMECWSQALCSVNKSRDPNKYRFFVEFLKGRFIQSLETAEATSVDAYNNIDFFGSVLTNFGWRGGDAFKEIQTLAKKYILESPIPFLTVRAHFGSLFACASQFVVSESPIKLDCEIVPKMEPFVQLAFDSLQNIVEETSKYQLHVKSESDDENANAKKLILVFKSVLEWLLSVCLENETATPPVLFRFIPLLCQFESYDVDPEVTNLCTRALSALSGTSVLLTNVEPLLLQLEIAAKGSSWRARACVLEFLKVLALNNANVFASNEDLSRRIVDLGLALLCDDKIEVRTLASSILSGFLHCYIVQNPTRLLAKFQKDADKFAMTLRKGFQCNPKVGLSLDEINKAHSTILGLCAFVEAHPYDCPSFLPELLITLTTHLHDPEPISGTIRECLAQFRATHQDNWSIHKTKFTEDQLMILTDIFISPCYYA